MSATTSQDTPHLKDAVSAKLEDWGPLAEATGSTLRTWGMKIWAAGASEAGIWECEAGPSYWSLDYHEVITIVSGRMTVTPDRGTPTELGAGDVAVFPKGWKGTWEIHETLRKVYVLS